MIKTLIATALLSLGVGAPTVQPPRKLNSPNTLYGMYCFKDEFTILWDTAYTVFDERVYDWNNYDGSYSEYQLAKCYYQTTPNTVGNFINIRYFDIRVDGEEFEFHISLGEDSIYNTYYTTRDTGIDSLVFDEQHLVLYFPTPTYIHPDVLTVFNSLFTSGGNQYVTYYNGYYNVANANSYYSLYGSFIVDNNIYSNLSNDYSRNLLASGIGGQVNVIQSGNFVVANRNILINNTLIPNTVLGAMSSNGTFAYVTPSTDNTFADMIYSVIDAPIYYLTSLFNFKLFGIEMYAAFMSIVTLLLIVVVIRKMI